MAKAKKREEQQQVIDIGPALPAVSEDQALVTQAGTAVMQFMRGVGVFFSRASALEETSKALLLEAKGLKPPTNFDEDEAVQRFVKRSTATKKEVEAHWTITATISGFHRRMTAARSRATDPAEEANKIGNRLHNDYVEQEKQRAARESARLLREAEEMGRRLREAELQRLEAEAIAAEEARPDLSLREQAFVADYALNGNGQRAAQVAGYKDAMKSAVRLLTLPKVREAIKATQEAAALRKQAAARREQPIEVDVPEVKPDISTAYGTDRTTWSGEVFDADKFVDAFMLGEVGIPRELIVAYVCGRGDSKLNEYARSLHERLNLWPGVRAKKRTGVI